MTLTPRPIIKSLGEDTSNKNSPSQTAIGEGVPYSGNITSSEPNGFLYIIYEAAKNLQRTGGMYGATIPYSKGQSCKVLVQSRDYYAIKSFVCMSASETTGNAPYSGATVTTLNGVDVYAGGVINTTYWYPADFIDGYDPAITTYTEASTSVAALAAVNYKNTGRQYVNVTNAEVTATDPETDRNSFAKAPTLEEILALMDGIYYPKWATQALDVATSSVRRLGSYIFRGQRVEAFGMFLSGHQFTDNGTGAESIFWRSMSSTYPTMCVINNTTLRDYFFSGSAGSTITPKNYIGRVQACAGTPILSSGTADARASLGGVQDDQIEGHWHESVRFNTAVTGTGKVEGNPFSTGNTTLETVKYIQNPTKDAIHGPVRVGYNTREATFTGPVPMVVTLVPYGVLTL